MRINKTNLEGRGPILISGIKRTTFHKSFISSLQSTQSIYKFGLSVCLFVSNKRQNGLTDWNQILCGTSHNPKESLWMIKISKISLQLNWNFIKFWKYTIFFIKSANFFTMYTIKEKMFTIVIENGCEASWKHS